MEKPVQLLLREDGFYEFIGRGFAEAQTGDVFVEDGTGEVFEITVINKFWNNINHPIRFTLPNGKVTGYMRECDIHSLYRKIIPNTTELSIDKEGKELFLEVYDDSLLINLNDLYTLEETYINLNKEEVLKLKSFLDNVLNELK